MKRIALTLLVAAILWLPLGCGQDDDSLGGSGLLETTEVVVSAETSGRALAIPFDEGSEVAFGDTLAVIDPSRLELELTAARAGREVAVANLAAAQLKIATAREAETYARSERDRLERLLQSGTAQRQQFDKLAFEHTQAELAVKTAAAAAATIEAELVRIDADLGRLERTLKDCYPLSPMTGVVTERFVDVGELLAPGKPIARIARLDTLWVKAYLPAGAFAGVKIGDAAQIDTESGGQVYQGQVVWTSPEAEFTPKNVQTEKSRANLVYAVKVRLPNTDGALKVGMPVFVTLGEQ